MKKIVLLTIVVFAIIANTFSQNVDSTITKVKKRYYLNDHVLNRKQLRSILLKNPTSAATFRKASSNGTIGSIFMLIGSGVICYGAYENLRASKEQLDDVNNGNLSNTGNPIKLGTILVGAGIITLSLPFNITSNKLLKQSVEQYNSSRKGLSSNDIQLNFIVQSNSLGIRLNF